MITFRMDGVTAVSQTVQNMVDDVAKFGREEIPQELTTWQTEDMHRRYPNTDTPDAVSAETLIWPRSRTWDQTHRTATAGGRRHPTQQRPLTPRPRLVGVTRAQATSHRPILRPALFDKLCARMDELLTNKLKWRKAPR